MLSHGSPISPSPSPPVPGSSTQVPFWQIVPSSGQPGTPSVQHSPDWRQVEPQIWFVWQQTPPAHVWPVPHEIATHSPPTQVSQMPQVVSSWHSPPP
jgi:hypothetical protein